MKKVSVIVPVYKVEKYLNKCLESLVNQTLQDIEIIVVNDGSPDNSQSIIDNFKQNYPEKIISIIKENGGQGSARNVGLEKSSGQYIGYVDSDDYIELDMYEKLYNKAITNDFDVVICDNFVVNEKNEKKYPECNYKNEHSTLENAFLGKIAVWNKIYKRKILIDSHTFDNDALIMKGITSNKISLKNKETGKTLLTMDFTGFPYLAIWSKPNAPFICIEPWYSTADSVKSTGVFTQKQDIISLKPNTLFECKYTVEFF